MKISLKIQWEKSKHYIGGFFGLSIEHLLFRAGSVQPRFLVVSSSEERFDWNIFSSDKSPTMSDYFLT